MWKVVFVAFAALFAVAIGSRMSGAPVDANIDEEGVRQALSFAVVQHNARSNDAYLTEVAEVISAQKQVVAGLKYIITVKMGKTSCRKGSANDVCAVHQDPALAQTYQCTFTVWSRPWLNDIQLLSEKC